MNKENCALKLVDEIILIIYIWTQGESPHKPHPNKNFLVHTWVMNNAPVKEHATFGWAHHQHQPHTVFCAGNIDCCYSALPGFEYVLIISRHVQSGRPRICDLGRMFKKYENPTHLNPRCRYWPLHRDQGYLMDSNLGLCTRRQDTINFQF